jgi:hypothetical protein
MARSSQWSFPYPAGSPKLTRKCQEIRANLAELVTLLNQSGGTTL